MHDPETLYADFQFADNVNLLPLHWLWPNRIPLAKLTLLIGDPGVGKSLLIADLAARVSAARPWPDSISTHTPQSGDSAPPSADASAHAPNPDPAAPFPDPSIPQSLNPSIPTPLSLPHGGVILLTPEDDPQDTLLPRLIAADADLQRICILNGVSPTLRSWLPSPTLDPPPNDPDPSTPQSLNPSIPTPLSLPDHLPALKQAVRAVNCPRLLVIDPLHAVLSPKAQSGSPALAEALAGLAETADKYNIAVVAVCHLTKTGSQRLLYRIRGSLNFVAAARAVHILTNDPDHPDRRILSAIKTVYGPPPPPIAFRITSAPPNSLLATHTSQLPPFPRLIWNPPAPAACVCPSPSLPQSLSPSIPQYLPPDLSPDAHSALSDACNWLVDYLAAGPRPVPKILPAARAAGHSLITLRRAKRILAVRAIKPSVDDPWFWTAQRPDNEGDHLGVAQT